VYNDLYFYNIGTSLIKDRKGTDFVPLFKDTSEEDKNTSWVPIEGEGAKAVAGRSAHTLVNGGDGYLYLFGGSDGTQALSPSSFYRFHLGKNKKKKKIKRRKEG